MFTSLLDTAMDLSALAFMIFGVIYIVKIQQHSRNPAVMLFSPLVFRKYLIFLVSLVVVFFTADIIADEIIGDPLLAVYSFDIALAIGSFGIMMITRRVYRQIVHPADVKQELRKELDEIRHRRMQFKEEQFKEENR